jgi:lipopolysaccharide/colanic/teichoic acid biosynthesis glycosyltransferase
MTERSVATQPLVGYAGAWPAARPAPPSDPYREIALRIRRALERGEGIWVASPHLEWLARRVGVRTRTTQGVPLIWFGSGRVGTLERVASRLLELVLVTAMLVAGAPLWLLIALAIALDGGPLLFRSLRAGLWGGPFHMLKFRTMKRADSLDVERRRLRRSIIQGETRGLDDGKGRRLTKDPQDRRITRFGRILRRLSLDEVPQFLNVLGGSMALVGPRPYPLDEVESFKPWHHLRHAGRPGITGLWQVSGRSTVAFDESVMLDIYYLANRTFWRDLQIIGRTPYSMLFGPGAY